MVTPPSPGADPDSDMEQEALLTKLAQEGGVELQNYLLLQAISDSLEESSFITDYDSNMTPAQLKAGRSNPDNWISPTSYRHLPADERKKWDQACKDEINGLKKQNVFEVVDLPRGHKPISC